MKQIRLLRPSLIWLARLFRSRTILLFQNIVSYTFIPVPYALAKPRSLWSPNESCPLTVLAAVSSPGPSSFPLKICFLPSVLLSGGIPHFPRQSSLFLVLCPWCSVPHFLQDSETRTLFTGMSSYEKE